MPRQTPKQLNEQGFASVVIALILIIVLALLTVGFAQLARREQKSALNKQLASQAQYAAESGINDAKQKLPALEALAAAGTLPSPDTCIQLPGNPPGPVTVGPSQNGVQYTCVLVNLKPPSVVYDNVQPEAQRYITSSAVSASGAGASSITVNWGSADGNNTFPGDMNEGFTPAASWNQAKRPAVLEFSLTPLSDLNRNSLANNTLTVYLYPVSNGSGNVAYGTVSQANSPEGTIVAADCNPANGAKYPCKATITGLSGSTAPYLFRIVNHYDPSNVSINGKDNVGRPTGFDGQTVIDVTGKAHEVLKRLQIHASRKPSYDIPADALESQSTCKHFTTDPISDSQTITLTQDSTGACALN